MRPLVYLTLACICAACWYVAWTCPLETAVGVVVVTVNIEFGYRIQDWREVRRKRRDFPAARVN